MKVNNYIKFIALAIMLVSSSFVQERKELTFREFVLQYKKDPCLGRTYLNVSNFENTLEGLERFVYKVILSGNSKCMGNIEKASEHIKLAQILYEELSVKEREMVLNVEGVNFEEEYFKLFNSLCKEKAQKNTKKDMNSMATDIPKHDINEHLAKYHELKISPAVKYNFTIIDDSTGFEVDLEIYSPDSGQLLQDKFPIGNIGYPMFYEDFAIWFDSAMIDKYSIDDYGEFKDIMEITIEGDTDSIPFNAIKKADPNTFNIPKGYGYQFIDKYGNVQSKSLDMPMIDRVDNNEQLGLVRAYLCAEEMKRLTNKPIKVISRNYSQIGGQYRGVKIRMVCKDFFKKRFEIYKIKLKRNTLRAKP